MVKRIGATSEHLVGRDGIVHRRPHMTPRAYIRGCTARKKNAKISRAPPSSSLLDVLFVHASEIVGLFVRRMSEPLDEEGDARMPRRHHVHAYSPTTPLS